jgi:hypothetical protein
MYSACRHHLVALFVRILQQLTAAVALGFKHRFGSGDAQLRHTHVREDKLPQTVLCACSMNGFALEGIRMHAKIHKYESHPRNDLSDDVAESQGF